MNQQIHSLGPNAIAFLSNVTGSPFGIMIKGAEENTKQLKEQRKEHRWYEREKGKSA